MLQPYGALHENAANIDYKAFAPNGAIKWSDAEFLIPRDKIDKQISPLKQKGRILCVSCPLFIETVIDYSLTNLCVTFCSPCVSSTM